MDFHKGHIQAVGVCPLCGEIITRTREIEMTTGNELTYASYGRVVGVTQTREPTVRIKWMCAAGCEIEVKGAQPRRNLDFFEPVEEPKLPKPEPLTGENLRELSPKVEQARHALAELGEGIDHDTKGESRSDAEPGRPSSSE